MTEGIISVGILGAGYISTVAHLPSLARVKQAQVAAICDKNESIAREVAGRFRIPKVYSKLEDMLANEQLGLVDVCLPPHLHTTAVKTIINQGCNVLVEKPLTVSTADSDTLIQMAKDKKVRLFVIHNYSAVPALIRAKELVAKGLIGDVIGININHFVTPVERYLDPNHWNHNLPGEYFSEMLPHLTMLLVEFLGPARQVQATAAKISNMPIKYDEMRIIAQTDKGVGSINISLNCPVFILTVDIIGTQGAISMSGDYQAVVLRRLIPAEAGALTRGIIGVKDILSRSSALASTSLGVLLGKYAPYIQGHRHLIQQCIADLQGKGTYPIDTSLVRESVRLMEMAFNQISRS